MAQHPMHANTLTPNSSKFYLDAQLPARRLCRYRGPPHEGGVAEHDGDGSGGLHGQRVDALQQNRRGREGEKGKESVEMGKALISEEGTSFRQAPQLTACRCSS